MISVAHIKKRGNEKENFEEIRGYDALNIQPGCFIFQWYKTQQTLIIPMDTVDYITTSQEETE